MAIKNEDIHRWLQSKPYQTERGETGEYLMYFDIDMPKILEDYYQWRKKVDEIQSAFDIIDNTLSKSLTN